MRCLIISLISVISLKGLTGYEIIRETLNGRVQGYETESLPGQYVEQYLGIPYARPPVGSLRFERPQDVENWSGVLNATTLPPACPQSGGDNSYIQAHLENFDEESENCLFLNIYVPKVQDAKKTKLAVFAWVHGGSNEVGMGAMLRGDLLAARTGVIVVNINYRLDILGFFSFDNDDFPGNLGLLDQHMALQWIHQNIQAFDGDPEKVTLAGHSAGALNVGVHMVSPLSKGLFQSAVLQSGSAVSFWSLITPAWRKEYRKCALAFLSDIECTFKDSKRIKSCLKQKTVKELQKADFQRVPGFPIRHPVVVDGYMLPEDPVLLLRNNQSNVDTVLMGFTKDEGIYLLGSDAYYQSSMGMTMGLDFVHDFLSQRFYNLGPRTNVALIVHEYVNWSDPTDTCLLVHSCAEMFADRGFSAPLHRTANYLTNYRQNSTYMYTFEFDIKEYESTECDYWHGVPHGRDIFYLFGIPLIGHYSQSFVDGDKEMSNAFMDMWGSFINTGKPKYHHGNQSLEPYNTETKPYIRMYNAKSGQVAFEMAYNYKPRKMAFWNKLMVDRENVLEECAISKSTLVLSSFRFILPLCIFVLLDFT